MNIAILDYTLSKTHIRFNIANFKQLARLSNLYIVNCNGYYDEFARQERGVRLFNIELTPKQQTGNSITGRIHIIENMKKNKSLFREFDDIQFDAVILMGFEVITFSLSWLFLPRNVPIYIFQHQQLDELENPIKRFFYNTYKNRVHHIVLEKEFENYMRKELKAMYVHTVHNISYVEGEADISTEKDLIIAISSHNDDKITGKIIKEQKENGFLKECRIHMYIRSHELQYQDDYLTVSYEYLTGEEYDSLFRKAFAVLTPVSNSFHRRISGPVIDGMTNGKIIICSNKWIFDRYSAIAPSLFRYFNGVNELIDIITQDKWMTNMQEVFQVKEMYSPEGIFREYQEMIKGINLNH